MNEFLLENDSELAMILEEEHSFDFKIVDQVDCTHLEPDRNHLQEILFDAISYNEELLNGFNRVKSNHRTESNSFQWLVVILSIISSAVFSTGSISSTSIGYLLLIVFVLLSFTYDLRQIETLEQLLENIRQLDKLFAISNRYLQEMEVLSRGYKLSSKLPPLERLELSLKNRCALDLRLKLLQASNIFLGVNLISDVDVTLQSIKIAIRSVRTKRIEQYYKWINECQSTFMPRKVFLEILDNDLLVNEAISLTKQGLQNLLYKFSHSNVTFPTTLDNFHCAIHQIHASALLFADTSIQTRAARLEYLQNMSNQLTEIQKLCLEQLSEVSEVKEGLRPTEKIEKIVMNEFFVDGNLSSSISSYEPVKINDINWNWNMPCLLAEAEVFEGDPTLADINPHSTLSRKERIERAKIKKSEIEQLKQQKGSEIELISELGKVLKARKEKGIYELEEA